MQINDQLPEEIKARLKIEEVIGSYLPLRRAGRTFKANCPFHQEKTPSFMVNPERGIFKCFGCGEGGDIFAFVMKLEGLTFPETLELLAEKAGLPYQKPEPQKSSTGSYQNHSTPGVEKPRIYALNTYCAKTWQKILLEHPKAKEALEYLTQKRGLSLETIQQFGIGYAPPGNVTLLALQKAGFTNQEIKVAGDPGKFQDRITFPIQDLTGKVVGFTGRILTDLPGSPKYWNTPETPIFVKSRSVYALNFAKNQIHELELAIIAEGQMDVIALHQGGYSQAVASSGTALTFEQLRLIARFTNAVAFAYDQDSAGFKATLRGLELALQAELTPYVITIPAGKDPADCLQTNPSAWEKAAQAKEMYMDWILRVLLPEKGFQSLPMEKRKPLTKDLLHWYFLIPDAMEQESWLRKLSAHLQTDLETLKQELKRIPRSFNRPSDPPTTPTNKEVTPDLNQPQKPERLDVHAILQLAAVAAALLYTSPEIHAILGAQYQELANLLNRKGNLHEFKNPLLNIWLYELYVKEFAESKRLESGSRDILKDPQSLKVRLPSQTTTALELAAEEALLDYAEQDFDSTWVAVEATKVLHRVKQLFLNQEKEQLAKEIARAQELGDQERLKELFTKLTNLV